MSSLIPERPLIISPSLAATIGLEEAILLQVLNDTVIFCTANHLQNFHWYELDHQTLINLLPFWNATTLQRVINSLHDKGIILVDHSPTDSNSRLCFAMNEAQSEKLPLTKNATTAIKPLTSNPSRHATANSTDAFSVKNALTASKSANAATPVGPIVTAAKPTNAVETRSLTSRLSATVKTSQTRGASLMSNDWQPEDDLLQLLTLNHAIPRDFSLSQCEDFVLYWLERREVTHSWPSKFRQHVIKEWRFHQSREQSKTTTAQDISEKWHPSLDALEILHRTGITPDFIEDSIPEFVLYWSERGEACSTWNSKFIAHIRRQWAKYTKTLELDYEPRQISANWQPNEDVYDILKLANIDIAFSRQLVAEFVLFWRDTKEIQRSWNTKFLQHVKYQWATRHHMEQYYAGQSIAHQSAKRQDQSPFKQLTDRSWAEGLVEGL